MTNIYEYFKHSLDDSNNRIIAGNFIGSEQMTIGDWGLASDYPIGYVRVKGYKRGSPTGNVVASIQATGSGGKPSNVDLCSGSVLASSISTSSDYVTFTMSSTPTLTNGSVYHIVLKAPDATPGNDFILNYTDFSEDITVADNTSASNTSSQIYGAIWGGQTQYLPTAEGAFYNRMVRLKCYRVGSPGNMELSFRRTAFVGGVGIVPTSSDLSTVATTSMNSITTGTSGEWVDFELPTSYYATYSPRAIVWRVPAGDASNYVRVLGNTNGAWLPEVSNTNSGIDGDWDSNFPHRTLFQIFATNSGYSGGRKWTSDNNGNIWSEDDTDNVQFATYPPLPTMSFVSVEPGEGAISGSDYYVDTVVSNSSNYQGDYFIRIKNPAGTLLQDAEDEISANDDANWNLGITATTSETCTIEVGGFVEDED